MALCEPYYVDCIVSSRPAQVSRRLECTGNVITFQKKRDQVSEFACSSSALYLQIEGALYQKPTSEYVAQRSFE